MADVIVPTQEQQEFVDALVRGDHIIGQAVAGSGKTTTLGLLGKALPALGKRGLYVAFNRAIVEDVQDTFDGQPVNVMTFHSMALSMLRTMPGGSQVARKLGGEGGSKLDVIKKFGIRRFDYTPVLDMVAVRKDKKVRDYVAHEEAGLYTKYELKVPQVYYDDDEVGLAKFNIYNFDPTTHDLYYLRGSGKGLRPARVHDYALASLRIWCQSDADEMRAEDVVLPPRMSFMDVALYRECIMDLAMQMWDDDITQPDGIVRFEHDYYLKMVSLADPDLTQYAVTGLRAGDVIFFDEAQDARPAMTRVIRKQAEYGCTIVIVGDSAQAIYASFTGARDALLTFERDLEDVGGTHGRGIVHLPLTTAWRFGEDVAHAANDVLSVLDHDLAVRGNPQGQSAIAAYPCTAALPRVRSRLQSWVPDPSMMDQDILDEITADMHMRPVWSSERMPDVDAVLTRSNGHALEIAYMFYRAGVPYSLVMRKEELRNFTNDYVRLEEGDKPWSFPLKQFETYQEMMKYPETEGVKDEELAMTIEVVSRLSPEIVQRVLNNATSEDTPGAVAISTVHKAKGRQWNRVMLYGTEFSFIPGSPERVDRSVHGFGRNREKDNDDPTKTLSLGYAEALRLLYVGLTRGRVVTYVPYRVIAGLTEFAEFVDSHRDHQHAMWVDDAAYAEATAPVPLAAVAAVAVDAGGAGGNDDDVDEFYDEYAINAELGFDFYED